MQVSGNCWMIFGETLRMTNRTDWTRPFISHWRPQQQLYWDMWIAKAPQKTGHFARKKSLLVDSEVSGFELLLGCWREFRTERQRALDVEKGWWITGVSGWTHWKRICLEITTQIWGQKVQGAQKKVRWWGDFDLQASCDARVDTRLIHDDTIFCLVFL